MTLAEIELKKAYRKWHTVAGVFRSFVRASNFVSLKHYPDFELTHSDHSEDLIFEKIQASMGDWYQDKTLLMVDLPDEAAIEAAWALYHKKGILPVITFKGLIHSEGLICSKAYISRLLQGFDDLEAKADSKHAFILDHNRYDDNQEPEVLRRCFNNQYELNEEDLPAVEMIRKLGYDQVLYLFPGTMKEDLSSYLTYLEENEMTVIKVAVGGWHEASGGC